MTPNWFLTCFMQLFWNLESPTDMLYKAPYIHEHLGTWPVLHSSNFLLIGRNSFTDCVPKVNYFLLKLLTCVLSQFSGRVGTRNRPKAQLPLPSETPPCWLHQLVQAVSGDPGAPFPQPLLLRAVQLQHLLDLLYSQAVCQTILIFLT